MRLPVIRLVVPDGAGSLPVVSATIEFPVGSDVIQPVEVVHQDGSIYDLGGAVAGILGYKYHDTDLLPFYQKEWDITGTNTAEFFFPRTDSPVLKTNQYAITVQFRDDDTGFEDTILVRSRAIVGGVCASFEVDVHVSPSEEPLARGPIGLPGVVPPLTGITSSVTTGKFGYISGANAVALTDSEAIASSVVVGFSDGTASSLRLGWGELVPSAAFTTAGGSPTNGQRVWLASALEDGSTGAGKLTATEPLVGVLAEVGIVVDNSNYAGLKTAKVLFQPKTPVEL